jgi:sarcosine oxidase
MDAEVVVVGGGVAGLATAYALAKDGRDVLVLEQFRIGHTRGSSHGASRIFRLAHREREWVELARQALDGWRAVEADVGEKLLELNGIVELLVEGDAGSREALEACGIGYEELPPDEVERRFGVRVPERYDALFQPEAGFTYADRACGAFLVGAVARGARLKQETRVRAVADGIVETETETIKADAVVVTAGAWARKLLAPAGIDLPVQETIQTVAYFRHDSNGLPAVVDWDPDGKRHAMYSLPDPGMGLKAGAHGYGPPVDPDNQGGPDEAVLRKVTDWVRACYPKSEPDPVRVETCLYTSTEDESFIMERRGGIVIGSACSGQGFKFAPVIGERLAALATG